MATVESLQAELNVLKSTVSTLLGNSREPKDGVATTSFTPGTLFPVQKPGENVTFIDVENFFKVMLNDYLRPTISGYKTIKKVGFTTRTAHEVGDVIDDQVMINGELNEVIAKITAVPFDFDTGVGLIFQSQIIL